MDCSPPTLHSCIVAGIEPRHYLAREMHVCKGFLVDVE